MPALQANAALQMAVCKAVALRACGEFVTASSITKSWMMPRYRTAVLARRPHLALPHTRSTSNSPVIKKRRRKPFQLIDRCLQGRRNSA